MENPTWDDPRPHSDEEIKGEISRLLGEVEGMMERAPKSRAQRPFARRD